MTLTPCLWFDGCAEEAARFYAATIPDSRVEAVHRSPVDYPAGRAGDVLTVDFVVAGTPLLGMNGGPGFPFTNAVSFQIHTDDQAETDRLWDALVVDGGEHLQCGWLRDRFGLSWQVTPRRLTDLLASPDPGVATRAMTAMMAMTRIDIAALDRAAAGTAA